MITDLIQQDIKPHRLLDHRFYVLWAEGRLNREILADYARQYYAHVEAFPRYISQIHSHCESLDERGEENHPKLWRDFANHLAGKGEVASLERSVRLEKTQQLVDTYFQLCRESYAAGLGALYACEYQTPDVAQTKIEGLKTFYGVHDEKALKFFELHSGVDVWHSQEVAQLIEKLPGEQKNVARQAAVQAAQALCGFLDGMLEAHQLQ